MKKIFAGYERQPTSAKPCASSSFRYQALMLTVHSKPNGLLVVFVSSEKLMPYLCQVHGPGLADMLATVGLQMI